MAAGALLGGEYNIRKARGSRIPTPIRPPSSGLYSHRISGSERWANHILRPSDASQQPSTSNVSWPSDEKAVVEASSIKRNKKTPEISNTFHQTTRQDPDRPRDVMEGGRSRRVCPTSYRMPTPFPRQVTLVPFPKPAPMTGPDAPKPYRRFYSLPLDLTNSKSTPTTGRSPSFQSPPGKMANSNEGSEGRPKKVVICQIPSYQDIRPALRKVRLRINDAAAALKQQPALSSQICPPSRIDTRILVNREGSATPRAASQATKIPRLLSSDICCPEKTESINRKASRCRDMVKALKASNILPGQEEPDQFFGGSDQQEPLADSPQSLNRSDFGSVDTDGTENMVAESQPLEYWLGRFMTLSNAYRYMESFDEPDEATAINTIPLFSAASFANRKLLDPHIERALAYLEAACITMEALDSFFKFHDQCVRACENQRKRERSSTRDSPKKGK
ncbi:hypothetical protein ASPZODRAFT_142190 [Penicilliopsis zonata CBS 506.65]|uniref:Uncharacterized protein n=1 Tax=Penicilliopsis zonata CBS 506.65 TaxID=1073090 RepID=A0A1L9SGR0_9EURO|nr:hypothetical protein ASPZODRAFT_142190 [Penicilliopsis zonata CBS 506.65]OJJ46369.1 hypothetical protein ASPZODRAFT_142190 [Penicilliopsis zonata CBS 506.65]